MNSIAEEASVLVEYRSASEECLEEMYGKFVVLVEEHLKERTRIDVQLIGRRPASGEHVPEGQAALIARTDEVLRELGGVRQIHHQESSTDANIPLSLASPPTRWRRRGRPAPHARGVGREGQPQARPRGHSRPHAGPRHAGVSPPPGAQARSRRYASRRESGGFGQKD